MSDDQQQPSRSILFVLPTHFASRNILTSNLPNILGEQDGLRVFFASLYHEDQEKILSFDNPRLHWLHLKKPIAVASLVRPQTTGYFCQAIAYELLHLFLLNRARHASLVYRFNELKGFFGHQMRKTIASWPSGNLITVFKAKRNHFNAQRYADPKLGWPFPKSTRLYEMLRRCYSWHWGNRARVETFFDLNSIDTVIINFIQTARISPYVNAAKRRHIPIIGMVGSWDNPTLKGPVIPDLSQYLVQSSYMAEQLVTHHGIARERVVITGWPQMDIYHQKDLLLSRDTFLASIGLAPDQKLILFGANTSRLGTHEISILNHMQEQLQAGNYGNNTTLMIRPHPGDSQWERRFKDFVGQESILVEKPSYTDRIYFANLIHHADIVLSSAGTISLDAVAFDTCTINIAFDGDLDLPPEKSVRMFYQLEHYASIIETGGTIVVHNYQELDQSVRRFLQAPEANSAGRQRLRRYHLEPLDGLASQRIANVILS